MALRTSALATAVALAACSCEALAIGQGSESCEAQEQSHRAQVLAKMAMFDVNCEEMCKKLGAYPDGCQCPGFAGNPSSAGDLRKCIDQYCQDPQTPCPTDGFVNCVDEVTKVSALQWSAVMNKVNVSLSTFVAGLRQGGNVKRDSADSQSCQTQQHKHHRALLQKLAVMDVKCEEMCKKMGVYPDGCQCPGFGSGPATSGDMRKCVDKLCQDPKNPCPHDGFITCVDEATKVSVLQWDHIAARMEATLDAFRSQIAVEDTVDRLLIPGW